MIVGRGGWFLVVVVLTLIIGAFAIPTFSVVPALLGITLLLWFTYEWFLFQTRILSSASRLKVTRRVVQGGREVPMVWAGLVFEVRVRIENPGSASIPFAILDDRVPVGTEVVDGSTRVFSALPAGGSIEIQYTLKAPSPGLLRFEGTQVRMADLQGFFYYRAFVREPVEYLILPPLTDDEGRQRATKRFNTLPAPGIHRLRRPGSGSELLDLRDYRAGDPPKMIAWKPSARRDRLITKEFENDVPVRCILFLDTSDGVRLGPPANTLLTRLAGTAAVVAQASAANRDLVGLTTFDEAEAKVLSPARTKIHMILLMRRLAEVSSLQPALHGVPVPQLVQQSNPLAHELYPELMSRNVNSMPFTRLWIPLLDRKWGWIPLFLVLAGMLLFGLGTSAFMLRLFAPRMLADEGDLLTRAGHGILRFSFWWFMRSLNFAAWITPGQIPGLGRLPYIVKILLIFPLFLWTYFIPGTLSLIFWFYHSIRGLFGKRRKDLTRRKQLAALFSLQDGTGVEGVERYLNDDDAFTVRVAAFLQLHQTRCPLSLYDEQGRFRYRCEGKAVVLADAMVRAVGHARDNELYVLMADLTELGADLAPLVKACRVARARHHHVLVIVPWPADVPSPDAPDELMESPEDLSDKTSSDTARVAGYKLLKVVRRNLTHQYHQRFRLMRRQLSKVGATVMRVNDGDPVQVVLDRLDRLRGMRSRR